MLMVIAPATLLTLTSLLANILFVVLGLSISNPLVIRAAARAFGGCLLSIYLSLFAFGAVTLIAEQKRIYCSRAKQILYLFTFPVFISVSYTHLDVYKRQVPGLLQRQLQRHRKGKRRALAGRVIAVGADFGKQLAVHIGLFVGLYIRHALFINQMQQSLGKSLRLPRKHSLQRIPDTPGASRRSVLRRCV